jgi:SSS family solute:Na+ symporter
MISRYDDFIIAFYFVFILAIGVLFRRLSKNTSDYFRCGGAMPWWITGTSAWLATFSAWTFTGAAGAIYETGTLVLCLYYSNVIGAIVVLAYTGVRFRRMRSITWMEAVRARYGPFTEQFYTWLKIPILLFTAGVGLNAIGVFMAAVFQVDVSSTLIVLGTLVTLVAFAGGAWAVLASDFVQMCLIVTISIVAAFLALRQPQIGGVTGLIHKLPPELFHWSEVARLPIVIPWIAVMVWFGFSAANNMENSTMFLMAKSDRDARGMAVIPLLGSLIGPLIFFVPSLVAVITHPHLQMEFPKLGHPHEAAFVAVARDVMPQGLVGLLLCAMLGATLTNMDAAVNKGVGVFVRSFLKPIVVPNASEKFLLAMGKICTLIFGAIIIVLAVWIARHRTLGLFALTNQVAASLLGPMLVPLVWGMFIKKTPPWSAWTTAVLGFAVALVMQLCFRPQYVQHLMGWSQSLSGLETDDITLAVSALSIVAICSAWYFSSMLFYDPREAENERRTEAFFRDLRTPIDARKEGIANYDRLIYRLIGGLCIFYGGFILLLMFIPNALRGRACFGFCGGIIFALGAALFAKSSKMPLPQALTDLLNSDAILAETANK